MDRDTEMPLGQAAGVLPALTPADIMQMGFKPDQASIDHPSKLGFHGPQIIKPWFRGRGCLAVYRDTVGRLLHYRFLAYNMIPVLVAIWFE